MTENTYSCDDPPHGTDYHSFFDEIEENKSQLMEFMNYDRETCKDIFSEDSVEYLWIFKHNDNNKRTKALQDYIQARKDAKDRFPDSNKQEDKDKFPDHNAILSKMKELGIQYYIAPKQKTVDKMINVFKQSAFNIGYNIETTSELTEASQLFDTVYHSISSALVISKEEDHTHVQQRARLLYLAGKEHNNSSETVGHVFQVYCGIDFGTDGTAFSYCLPGDDKVYTPNWGSDDRIYGTKLKTNILLDASENYKCVGFGQGARDTYARYEASDSEEEEVSDEEIENNGNNKKKDLLFFEKFKMALYKPPNSKKKKNNDDEKKGDDDNDNDDNTQDIKEYLTAINGQKCQSKTVIIEALKFVKIEALKAMRKTTALSRITVDQCQWVLTVPAIWSNRSKGIMIHCAKKAGLINQNIPNHLIIAFEPLSVCLFEWLFLRLFLFFVCTLQ